MTWWTYGAVAAVVVVIADRVWQQIHTKWTNEPPMLPYLVPFFGHGWQFIFRGPQGAIKAAAERFSERQPFSLLLFGTRLYVFPDPEDGQIAYKKSKALSFIPLFVDKFGPAWGLSEEGVIQLTGVGEDGETMVHHGHVFYRNTLKNGPDLDNLTLRFAHYLHTALDSAVLRQSGAWLFDLTQSTLAVAAANAALGPRTLLKWPKLLQWAQHVHESFLLHVHGCPRFLAPTGYNARDEMIKLFSEYLDDPATYRAEGNEAFWGWNDEMRDQGISLKDRASYTSPMFTALVSNSIPISSSLLKHIYANAPLLARLRAELDPVFDNASGEGITLSQIETIRTECPLLRACFDEALRMYSPAISSRSVTEETTLAGYTLRPGQWVLIAGFASHRSERIFGQNLGRFTPDRFLEPGVGAERARAIRAFGGGATLCVGRFFASSMIMCYVAMVVCRCDLRCTQKGGNFFFRLVERERGKEKAAVKQ